MATYANTPSADLGPAALPEDVRAELDADTRRLGIESNPLSTPDPVPEDVLAERDLEARGGEAELTRRLAEGTPPEDGEERPA